MTLVAAHSAIRTRFATQWGVTTPIQWPNQKFDAPDADPWVRFTIADADAKWASMGVPGNNIARNRGQVNIQIFTPSGEGEGRSLEYADQAKTVFRSWRFPGAGLRFLVSPYARTIGIDGKWHQVNVVAPFEFDVYT